ncbi:hypothetical protein NLG97_g768 [Lecanicillium saksenae]|uniref:Uncharacterized protein n=1 Tax=Lecanicillium saksenae TaxID=468837 RepID=A0ACC1R7F2_9HYPO|nr:hypothetical protein NLG97_g768 [Lecanicillium saksenae]
MNPTAALAVVAAGAIANGGEVLAPPSTYVPSYVGVMHSYVGSLSMPTEPSCLPEAAFCIDALDPGLIEPVMEDDGAGDDGEDDLPPTCEDCVTVVISTFMTSELMDSVTLTESTSELDQIGSIKTPTHATHTALGNDHDRATTTSSTISVYAASPIENASKGGSNFTDISESKALSPAAIAGLVAGTGICAAVMVCLMGWLLYRRCKATDRREEQPGKEIFELGATEYNAGAPEHELAGEHPGGRVIGTPVAELP